MNTANSGVQKEPSHPDEMRVAESLYAELLRFKYKPPRIKALALALHEAKAQGRREMKKECREALEDAEPKKRIFGYGECSKAHREDCIAALDTIKD